MSASALRRSLVSRLIVVSRKTHGARSNKPKLSEQMSLALPSPSEEEVAVAVELLSLHPWPKPYLWQAIGSLASSNCLHMVTQSHLTRLYQLVNKEEETADGSRPWLHCLSSLIPALANYTSLHPITQEALCQVITGQVGLSPDCEQSILHVFGDDPEQLTHLMKLARSHGHHFSRGYYRQVLGKVMEGHSNRPSPVVRELLQLMSGDLSRAELEADMFWVALHLARDPTQVQAIIRDMQTSCLELDESLSLQLMNACLRTAPNRDQPHTNTNTANPSHAVSTLVGCLLPQNAAVSATAFERVLTACADTRQLTQAVVTFMCMTQAHSLAPTRTGLDSLSQLLCHPLLTANHTLRKLRLGVCYHVLGATVQMFAGEPPPWVYVECSRPFTELLGHRGYRLMHDLCKAAVLREHGEERGQAILAELWSKDHYHQLMEACHVNHGLELGTFLLQEMIQKGISPSDDTVSLLLKFQGDRFNIDDYIVEIVKHMESLTQEQMESLQQPLYSAINRTLRHAMPERMRRPLISTAVEQLLQARSENWSNEECIRHLASLCRTGLWDGDRVVDGISATGCDIVHIKRATA